MHISDNSKAFTYGGFDKPEEEDQEQDDAISCRDIKIC